MDKPGAPRRADVVGDDKRAEFTTFFHDQYRKIVGMLLIADATREEAEDATSQAMEEAFKNWSQIKIPRAWVRRAAKRHFLKVRQRDRRHLEIAIERGAVTPQSQIDTDLSVMEDRQWVDALLSELTPTQRKILELLLDGLDFTEIAELLGKNKATIRKNLQHARERLRSRLDLITLNTATIAGNAHPPQAATALRGEGLT